MGRQGGQGKGKPKLKDRGFGHALVKQLNGKKKSSKEATKLNSILDNSALDDFIITAEMDDADVEVVRVHDQHVYLYEPTTRKAQNLIHDQLDVEQLQIPRKPSWTREMTAEDIDRSEKNAFLSWRRNIAVLENNNENMRVTPYEKNIEVWRQLWRVMEKCDICVQIVDGRNPLLYFTKDLVNYALELEPAKPIILLINKADYLTEYQRKQWSDYFKSENVPFVFYSAHDEQKRLDDGDYRKSIDSALIDQLAKNISTDWKRKLELTKMSQFHDVKISSIVRQSKHQPEKTKISPNSYDNKDLECDDESEITLEKNIFSGINEKNSLDEEEEISIESIVNLSLSYQWQDHHSSVLTREELISLFSSLPKCLNIPCQDRHGGRACIGMVGYPNVGKSSVINTILGVSKSTHGVTRVAVSSTPGKTKHFQTINVNDQLMLCDCPGLVFPSFMSNTGEMICSGILPINQMRDHLEPIYVLLSRVPMHLLEATYGITIKKVLDFKDNPNRPPTPSEFLSAYCAVKGYITGTGRWDEFRGCKDILKDFNDGRILYANPPPGICNIEKWMSDVELITSRQSRVAERLVMQRIRDAESLPTVDEESLESDEIFGDGFLVDESDGNESHESEKEITPASQDSIIKREKREHKRLKHWGKKGKKLRDKTPYSEENGAVSFVAFSTNRSIDSNKKLKGYKPNGNGSIFLRHTFPYQTMASSTP